MSLQDVEQWVDSQQNNGQSNTILLNSGFESCMSTLRSVSPGPMLFKQQMDHFAQNINNDHLIQNVNNNFTLTANLFQGINPSLLHTDINNLEEELSHFDDVFEHYDSSSCESPVSDGTTVDESYRRSSFSSTHSDDADSGFIPSTLFDGDEFMVLDSMAQEFNLLDDDSHQEMLSNSSASSTSFDSLTSSLSKSQQGNVEFVPTNVGTTATAANTTNSTTTTTTATTNTSDSIQAEKPSTSAAPAKPKAPKTHQNNGRSKSKTNKAAPFCSLCNLTFSTPWSLNRHMDRKHPALAREGAARTTCQHCQKRCNTVAKLRNHMRIHHNQSLEEGKLPKVNIAPLTMPSPLQQQQPSSPTLLTPTPGAQTFGHVTKLSAKPLSPPPASSATKTSNKNESQTSTAISTPTNKNKRAKSSSPSGGVRGRPKGSRSAKTIAAEAAKAAAKAKAEAAAQLASGNASINFDKAISTPAVEIIKNNLQGIVASKLFGVELNTNYNNNNNSTDNNVHNDSNISNSFNNLSADLPTVDMANYAQTQLRLLPLFAEPSSVMTSSSSSTTTVNNNNCTINAAVSYSSEAGLRHFTFEPDHDLNNASWVF